LLEQKKGADKAKIEEILRQILASHHDRLLQEDVFTQVQISDEAAQKPTWDPRWLQSAIKADLPMVVCSLAGPGDKNAISYLLQMADARKQASAGAMRLMADAGLIIRTLVRCEYAKSTDVFLDLVAKKAKTAQYVDYEFQLLLASARYLPTTDLSRLDEFAATLDEKFVDKYLEALAPVRAATQPN